MLPWVLLAAVLTVGAAGGTGYWKGQQHATARIEAKLLREAEKTRIDQAEALRAAAERIVALDIKNTTIRAKTEVITREVPVYRDCVHDDRTFRLLNDALSPAAGLPDQSEVPGADAAAGR